MEYRERNTSLTISNTTATQISDDKTTYLDTIRHGITITNTSVAAVITIAIDNEAVSGSGIVLNPGGVWSDTEDSEYLPTQARITAISSVAGGTVAIQERLS